MVLGDPVDGSARCPDVGIEQAEKPNPTHVCEVDGRRVCGEGFESPRGTVHQLARLN
jgi:hypothetical protein